MVKVCGSGSICVECSLTNDRLMTYAVCKHSKSPIFNRNMRTLNRVPIYLGEDLIDNVNRLVVLKDIVEFDKKKLKSVEYATSYSFRGGRYSEEIHTTHNYQYIADTTYPTGYKWIQTDNSIDFVFNGPYSFNTIYSSHNIHSYNRDTKNAKKLFRRWFKSISHKRIIRRFNYNMNKMYGDNKSIYLPLQDEPKYWIKQQFKDYHPIRNHKPPLLEDIKDRRPHIFTPCDVSPRKKFELEYQYRVDETRINQFERYKKLFISTENINEKLWFLMKMGMLCYRQKYYDSGTYPFPKSIRLSKDYYYLGKYIGHIQNYHTPERDGYNQYNTQFRKCYDLRQEIYYISNTDKIFSAFDIYTSYDNHLIKEFLHTNIEIPKINKVKHHYQKKVMKELIKGRRRIRSDCGRSRGPYKDKQQVKKKKICMEELISKTRRIRSDCGRSRGPNIRTTNPNYCIFTSYPEVDIGLIYHFPEL